MRILLFSILLILVLADPLYSTVNSKVTVLTALNFNKRITSGRHKGISVVHFHQAYDDLSKSKIKKQFEALADELNGMVFLGAVSCDDETAICEKEGITQYPSV